MYTSILKDKIKFLPDISKVAKDLIEKLTVKSPSDRLGAEYGFFDIKQHEFFKGVDWNKFMSKKVKPPFVPNPRESNFLPEFTQIPVESNFSSTSKTKITSKIAKKNRKNLSNQHNHSIIENRKEVEHEHEDWLRNVSIAPELGMK